MLLRAHCASGQFGSFLLIVRLHKIQYRPGATLTPEYLANLPRPWLVIEDSSHIYEHCLAAIEFFHPLIQKGEFLVIEDGIVDDLGASAEFNGGPNKAVKEFMSKHGKDYALVTDLCDFWGHNITWNPNGYWKKIA